MDALNEDTHVGVTYDISNELLSQITHQLSHDIGNPLTSIITYGSIIEQSVKLNIPPEKLSDYAKSMLSETWKISVLMEKFTLLVSKKKTNVTSTLNDISSKILSRYASRYGLGEFDIELEGFDTSLEIACESEQLCAALSEILVNAANEYRYLISKGTDLDLLLLLRAEPFNNSDILFICENQSEIHEEGLEKLFTPGYSSHAHSKKNVGIGLPAISNSAIRWGGSFSISQKRDISHASFKAILRVPTA